MANKQKGELDFEADGKRFTLCFSTNALCVLESEFDDAAAEITALIAGKSRKRVTTLRTLFWVGLSDHHPDLSKKDAGNIMTSLTFAGTLVKVGEAMALAYPEAAADPLAAPAPPAEAGGTGPSS